MRRGSVALIVIVLAACERALPEPADGGSEPDAPVAAAPALPTLTPCPPGWREVPGPVVRCDPWPEGGRRDDCAADEVHLPGSPGCARIGPACPADGWPEDLPADRTIVFVDAAGTGDGSSPDSPLASLADAVAGAPAGSIVAVRAGRYDVGELAPAADVTIHGACVAGTVLTTSLASARATITLASPGSGVRALAIEGAETTAVLATAEGTFVEDVLVSRALEHGIEAFGGSVRIARAAIRDVRADAEVGGDGVNVKGGAQVEIASTAIERVHMAGILVLMVGSHVTARDVVVQGTESRQFDRTKGRGIDVESGSSATLERVVIDGNRDAGLFVASEGTRCEARDVVIARTRPEEATAEVGIGGGAHFGATLILERAWVLESHELGLDAYDAGSLLELRDVVVERTLPRASTGELGMGLAAGRGGRLAIARAMVIESRGLGVIVDGITSRIGAEDLIVEGVAGEESDGEYGVAFWAQGYSTARIVRARLAGSRTAGVAALSESAVELEDVTIRDVAVARCEDTTCPEHAGGLGISAHLGATVRATRFVVEGAAVCGVAVAEGSAIDLSSGVITRAPIGACVQDPAYDVARLRDRVEYRDVGVPLQAARYDLPDPLDP